VAGAVGCPEDAGCPGAAFVGTACGFDTIGAVLDPGSNCPFGVYACILELFWNCPKFTGCKP